MVGVWGWVCVCVLFLFFVLFLFLFFLSSRRVQFKSPTALFIMIINIELDCWMNKIQENTELKKSAVQSVLLYLLHVYFNKQIHKKTEKKASKKMNSLNFVESNTHRKNKCDRAAALRHRIYFVSLILVHPSKETLNSPSSRVDADSTSR